MEKPFLIQNKQFQNNIFIDTNTSIPEIGIDDSPYQFQGRYVPRVTHILSKMLHEDSLMGWSNYIGLYKHQKYKNVLDTAADIGSYTHESIEHYIQEGKELDLTIVPQYIQDKVNSAYNAFKDWWYYVRDHKVSILMEETPLVCEYYGGTLDLLIKIDGRIYLVDFKTSNHIGYKYYLQLAAYRRILFLYHNINIDGCIILQLSKKWESFTEYMIDLHNYDDSNFMKECDLTFMSLVYSYYHRLMVESSANIYLKGAR